MGEKGKFVGVTRECLEAGLHSILDSTQQILADSPEAVVTISIHAQRGGDAVAPVCQSKGSDCRVGSGPDTVNRCGQQVVDHVGGAGQQQPRQTTEARDVGSPNDDTGDSECESFDEADLLEREIVEALRKGTGLSSEFLVDLIPKVSECPGDADRLRPELPVTIAVDFDGVLVEDRYPDVGSVINESLTQTLSALRSLGVKIIVWTCRQDEKFGQYRDALEASGIAVNRNIPERIAYYGGDTPKVSADLYIDDRALGHWQTEYDLLEALGFWLIEHTRVMGPVGNLEPQRLIFVKPRREGE